MQLIKDKDVTLYYQFELQNIQPHFFAFRWLTLLFSQEFILPGNSTCKVGLIQFLLRCFSVRDFWWSLRRENCENIRLIFVVCFRSHADLGFAVC